MSIDFALVCLSLAAVVVLLAGLWRTASALHPHFRWTAQLPPMSGWVYLAAFTCCCTPALLGLVPMAVWAPGVFVFALAGFALMLVRSQPMRFGFPTLA